MKQTENIKFKTAEKSDYKIQNQAEREELSFLAALNNSSILDKVAPIVAILEAAILLFSNIVKNPDFMKWQSLYNILYILLVCASVAVYIFNRPCRNNLHTRQRRVILLSHLYVAFIIAWNVVMLITDFHTTSQLDFALYFTSSLVSDHIQSDTSYYNSSCYSSNSSNCNRNSFCTKTRSKYIL